MRKDAVPGNAQTPLAGVVLCSTAIPVEQRTEYAAVAGQMGATYIYDLTSDVTHLLVGNIDTPKYKYVAKERPDVVLVTASWLEAVRASWMKGGDTDVEALEQEHRVPTFYNLKICLTGFDDLDQRHYISETVQQHGAEYHGDLTKAITHLIAAAPSGKKYDYAKTWGVKVVALEWLQDSIERGMALEAACYDPLQPPEQRGKGAWNRAAVASATLGKRNRDALQEKRDIDPNPRRKLHRAASTRLASQNGSIWDEITAGGLFLNQTEGDEWNAQAEDSLVVDTEQPGNRTATPNSVKLKDGQSAATDVAPPLRKQALRNRDGVFQGRIMFVHGFDDAKTSILTEHLNGHGAAVIRESADLDLESGDDLDQGYLVLPHDLTLASLPDPPESARRLSRVTQWWVEKCLHRKQLVDHSSDVLCKPFSVIGIAGFNGVVMSLTGFTGIDLLHAKVVIELMGATFGEYLTPQTSVLISDSPTPKKDKLEFANERKIPIVSTSWLRDSIQSRDKLPFEKYILRCCRVAQPAKAPCPFIEEPTAPLSEEDKAKLRRKEQRQKAIKPQGIIKNPPQNRRPMHKSNTLDLLLSKDPTPASPEFDDSNEANEISTFDLDDSTTTPLQDLPPEVNLPRRPSALSNHSTSTTESSPKLTPAPNAAENEPNPDASIAPEAQEALNSAIADLLARKKAAATVKADATTNPTKADPRKRPLGRAASGTSNPSTSTSFSRPTSLDSQKAQAAAYAEELTEEVEPRMEEYMPSQSLLYESPGVQAAREEMIRRMGGKVEEAVGVVGPIGVVRDVVSDAVLGRAPGRRRKL